MLPHPSDTGGNFINRFRIKHRDKSSDNRRINLRLNLVQLQRNLLRRNNGKVVTDLRTVKYPLQRLQPSVFQYSFRKLPKLAAFEVFQRRLGHPQIVLRQTSRIGSGISNRLVLFVERLRNL